MNGIIVINKEKGYTSHDVVAKLRGILHIKKIGHTGTLDPDATGVLPVCIGNATKVCDLIMDRTKTYTAGVKLGLVTDTQDISGQVLSEKAVKVSFEELTEATKHFLGEISQLTPMYSARKVNGQKLVDLARKGITVSRETKRITVHAIDILDFDEVDGTFSMRVVCSKGTYIRTLCNDIGDYLGCGACMTSLRRNASGEFTEEEALTLSMVEKLRDEGTLSERILSADKLFMDYGRAEITEEGRSFLHNGNPLTPDKLCFTEENTERVRVYEDDVFTALYEFRDRLYWPVKMFLQ